MAGTDSTRAPAETVHAGGGPAVILVQPQLGENIGTAARAMLNCGLADLRLVRPRDGWPNDKAVAAASGADVVLDRARLYARTEDAVADLHNVYAATTRARDMIKPVATARRAGADMRAAEARGERCGVLFGPERTGLENDNVALADTVLAIPLNPAFASLNLAQAVLLVAYEWLQAGDGPPGLTVPQGATRLANKEELLGLFGHLEAELDACGFLHVAGKRPIMVRNLRNIFHRARLMEQEVRTLRGVVACLSTRRRG